MTQTASAPTIRQRVRNWPPAVRTLGVLGLMVAVFLLAYCLPFERLAAEGRAAGAGREALLMLQDYAREHVLLCLVPALFIAGAISCFVSQAAVMKYFGAQAHKAVAYSVAAVSGTILAACSCTILPLFAGIYTRGAGLGPATAFLYSGPAINVLAIILTARVLGWQLGAARAIGAVVFSIVIGLTMHLIYRKEEATRDRQGGFVLGADERVRPLWQTGLYFAAMIGILVFANWAKPSRYDFRTTDGREFRAVVITAPDPTIAERNAWSVKVLEGPLAGDALSLAPAEINRMTAVPSLATTLWQGKWYAAGGLLLAVLLMAAMWYTKSELRAWVASTWTFAKQILPLLFVGVVVAGVLLGRPGHPALIPEAWIARAVGGNSLGANFFAAFAGALMYFATLTEVPILQGLIGAGMGKGPALALLLAGPALSLPNMLVIRSVMGTQKTIVYVALVVVLSTAAGLIYGSLAE